MTCTSVTFTYGNLVSRSTNNTDKQCLFYLISHLLFVDYVVQK